MANITGGKINQDFFKIWSPNMAYVLGYFVADGCISTSKGRIKNPYTFNITSVDLEHLNKIKKILHSNYRISKKSGTSNNLAYQIQVRNSVLTNDLINLGIHPRKTYNLGPIKVPDKYFPDFARGFFDGDGTVYIYNVNKVPQIKSGFVSASLPFLENFNRILCKSLKIPTKSIHKTRDKKPGTIIQYNICFYVNDSEKLAKFMYGYNSILCLERKKKVFEQWKSVNRRHYIKQNYPSKIGWHLNEGIPV